MCTFLKAERLPRLKYQGKKSLVYGKYTKLLKQNYEQQSAIFPQRKESKETTFKRYLY